MSGKAKHLRPARYQATIHVDSDFSVDPDNPTRFEVKLDHALHGVRIIKLHDVTIPMTSPPIDPAQAVQFTVDEERFTRAQHPRFNFIPGVKGVDDGEATSRGEGWVPGGSTVDTTSTSTPINFSIGGNFNIDDHYRELGDAFQRALYDHDSAVDPAPVPTSNIYTNVSALDPTIGVSLVNYWKKTDISTGLGNQHQELTYPLEQFSSSATFPDTTVAAIDTFIPRVVVRINRDHKTEIYTNFILRLRPLRYGNPAEALTQFPGLGAAEDGVGSLIQLMGFDITKQDPGVHEFLPIDRTVPGAAARTYFWTSGVTINGIAYPYRLTSEFPAEFQTERYLFVTAPTIDLNTLESNQNISSHNILARVPLTNYGTVPTFNPTMFHEHVVNINTLDALVIELKSPDGSTPNLQDVKGVSLTLRIWYDGQ